MESMVNSNRAVVPKTQVYGRTYLTGTESNVPGLDDTYRKMKNKVRYGRKKKHGSTGSYIVR